MSCRRAFDLGLQGLSPAWKGFPLCQGQRLGDELFGLLTRWSEEHTSQAFDRDLFILKDAQEVQVGMDGIFQNAHRLRR